ncbi:hypothetical protein TDB9533_01220 [Thalassocella blandensis]|nr:hypothetical protein TDB9533_01220 [Thalassocella blandensis]
MADLNSQTTPILSVYTWYRDTRLFVNRRYQRKLVWTLEEKQKLIESILKKYPIPAILVAEREVGSASYEIIDGLQRLHAIFSYIETAFSVFENLFFDLDKFPTAKEYGEKGVFDMQKGGAVLSQAQVSTILDYPLSITTMRGASEDEINDVFDRINTYGHRLSDQERRQAGIQNDFSDLIRKLACSLRGDTSDEVIELPKMPSVSIDLPLTKHGYGVRAEEVFWVRQGILRSTDLRDSMDEQCIADIAASILGGQLITRSKDALDKIYDSSTSEYQRILNALDYYGEDKFAEEFKYCIDELEKVSQAGEHEKLRDILFKKASTNPFPAVYAALHIAFHELFVSQKLIISDYVGVKKALENVVDRLNQGRGASSPEDRRKNINTIKGVVSQSFIKAKNTSHIYGSHSILDIDEVIRRSEAELPNYELKQGMLTLQEDNRSIDKELVRKVITTLCGISNIGPNSSGKLVIGVADKDADASRITKLDEVKTKKVGRRHVVGIAREAKVLGKTVEQYLAYWKNEISKSELSEPLKSCVLTNFDYHDYFGYGIIIITVPPQKSASFVGEKIYSRGLDSTIEVISPREIADVTARF